MPPIPAASAHSRLSTRRAPAPNQNSVATAPERRSPTSIPAEARAYRSRSVPRRRASRSLQRSAAVLGVGLAVTLVGCTPSPGPTAVPPSTPPTTPITTSASSPSPGPTASGTPVPAPSSTPSSGPDASWEVVEDFFEAFTHGLQTGDAAPLRALSAEECTSCGNFLQWIAELAPRDVSGTGGGFSLGESTGLPSPDSDRFVWRIEFEQEALEQRLSDPDEVVTTGPENGSLFVELVLRAGTWKVSEISEDAEVDP